MAKFCLLPDQVAALKEAARSGGIPSPSVLEEMTSQERRDVFAKYTDKETASQINAGFEKAVLSEQQQVLNNWVKNTFTPSVKKTDRYKGVIKKIEGLQESGALTPKNIDSFLEDLVAQKLGASITADEAQRIYEKSTALQEAGKLPENEFGLPPMEYWKAKKELEDYLDFLTPNSNLQVLTSIIRRGAMLFSVKSPVVNIESNLVNAIGESVARRTEALVEGGIIIKSANDFGGSYRRYARRVFQKTGYDVTRMFSFDDGRKNLGEERSQAQGKGAIRAVGRFYQDVVFDKLMTLPDVAFSAYHFTDSAELKANVIARREGFKGKAFQERVEQVFRDATRIVPLTPEGKSVREKAIQDAQFGTYTNNSTIAKSALMVREALNTFSGGLRLGDTLSPFVKTPANVVATTIDYSGIGLPIEIIKRSGDAWSAKRRGDADAFRQAFDRTFWRKVTRAGIGVSVALLVSQWFEPEDFIGEYPTSSKEQELLDLKKANTNSVRIGDRWISLDYLGPIGASFIGFMYARKYADSPPDAFLRYTQGGVNQLARTPGFKDFSEFLKGIKEKLPEKLDPEKVKNSATDFLVDYVRSFIPSIQKDIVKGQDTFQRETPKGDMWARLKQDFPFLRQELQEKYNIFGEFQEGEGIVSTILFGARIKKAGDDPIVEELGRLATTGNLPAITNVAETSPRAKALKEKIGDKPFRNAMIEFGQGFKEGITKTISSNDYKIAKDDEKKAMIDKVKDTLFEEMLEKYGYESDLKKETKKKAKKKKGSSYTL